MAKNNASIRDVSSLIAAGINPSTGLPAKLGGDPSQLKADIKKTLRILDEQTAVNRYVWYNLPDGLDGHLLERILYYRGQGMFFKLDDNFFFLPYSLDGTIDVYGRYRRVKPVPFNGKNEEDNKKHWITAFNRNVVYDAFKDYDKLNPDDDCVLLFDYTKQIPETIIARQVLNDPILEAMAEAFPMARTSLIAHSGVKGMRVSSQDEESNVLAASKSTTQAALTGNPWIPIVGQIEFQDLTEGGSAMKTEEYLQYMQSLDNYRLSLYGLDNGGVFKKDQYQNNMELSMNNSNNNHAYQDGLILRQNFCDMVNAIWGLGIWCEEPIMDDMINAMGEVEDGEISEESNGGTENVE